MAFRIAVSGLNAAQAALDVAGNNIANANTTGFKVARSQFADVFATSSLGTTNDAIGQGVKTASISQQFTQGSLAFTENNLDLAINGQGFFVLEEPSGSRTFSRAGAFGVDADGFVVNPTGERLIVFQPGNGAITGALGPLQITTANISPQATSTMEVGVNLDSAETVPADPFDPTLTSSFNSSTSTAVFDSLGQEHLASLFFRKTAPNTWESHLRIDGDNTQTLTPGTLAFDSTGQLTSAMPVNFGAFTPASGADPLDIDIDFSSTTQFEADFGVNALSQDGFATGRLNGVTVDDEGVVQARFTNGESEAQGQVSLANFANPQGLQPIGDTKFAETSDSGPALIGAPATASLGLVQSGALEEANGELAEQLVNVIVAQRSFQANAQMIQTEDEITQTIINIR